MRNATSAIAGLLSAFINIGAAFILGAILIFSVGESPLAALSVAWNGAFGSAEGVAYTLYYATNFVFTALAVAVAAQASEYNIGGEGQAYISGLGVGLMGLALPFLPWPVALVFGGVVGMAFGAAWALIPAWMSAYRGSHLVITTIMFNFLASLLMVYLIVDHLRPSDSMISSSVTINEGLWLPRVDEIAGYLGFEMRKTPLNVSVLLAPLSCIAVTFLVWHTRWGFDLRAIGANRNAAAYAGVNVRRVTLQAICLSGAFAGFVGLNEILGVQHRILLDFVVGYGFTGIAVALIGGNHPAGIIPAAILFGALYQGGATLAFMFPAVSREVVVVLQGLVILFAGGFSTVLQPWLAARLTSTGLGRKSLQEIS